MLPILFSSLLLLAAIHEAQSACSMYGACGPADYGTKTCAYDGPPKPLDDPEAESQLKEICPMLFEGGNNLFCCDAIQVGKVLEALAIPEGLGFNRCPSCLKNFRKTFCYLTCNGNQSDYLEVNQVTEEGDKVITKEITFHVSKEYTEGMFRSCKDVQGLSPGTSIMDLMCGRWGKDCNPQRWLGFIGTTTDEGGFSPVKINFNLSDEAQVTGVTGKIFYPTLGKAFACDEAPGPDETACSCVDCADACRLAIASPPPLPDPPEPWLIQEYDGLIVVMVLVFLLLAFVIVAGFVFYGHKSKNTLIFVINNSGAAEKPSKLKEAVDGPSKGSEWGEDGQGSTSLLARIGVGMEDVLATNFRMWGTYVARHPILVMLLSLAVSIVLSGGLLLQKLVVTTDPIKLWTPITSQARQDMEYFNRHFQPFYRIEQIIVTPKDHRPLSPDEMGPMKGVSDQVWGPVFRREFLLEMLALQQAVENITAEARGETITLPSICLAPLEPLNTNCAIQSFFGWYQNNASRFTDPDFDYLGHFLKCTKSMGEKECFAPYGGPLQSNEIIIGGFEGQEYQTATALVITIPIRNHREKEDNWRAMAWEKEYLDFLESYNSTRLDLAYMSMRSIEDELDRSSHSDILTVCISYLIMFAYIAISLGEINSFRTLLVDSKISLGFVGVIIVLLSVTASLGTFCYLGTEATLIIIEVVPFLVLAVGVDNIFILVQAFQRDERRANEDLTEQIGRVVGEVAPSMMLSSLSMASCFFIGALTIMPAVRIFALYAGVALLLNFLLQMTCFLALFTLDTRRQEDNRLDVLWCVRTQKKDPNLLAGKGLLYKCFKNIYAPFLMKNGVRATVLLVFFGWFCSSIAVIDKIDIGLRQELVVPEDSYMVKYFAALKQYLRVGYPLYFVITDGYDYTTLENQNKICSGIGCDEDSMMIQIKWMADQSSKTYVALPSVGWLDTYYDFLHSRGCCYYYRNGTHCPAYTGNTRRCRSCTMGRLQRPAGKKFMKTLPYFLQEVPGIHCTKGGRAIYAPMVELVEENNATRVGATTFQTYHTVLLTSQDHTEALKWARTISDWLTEKIRGNDSSLDNVRVFPYSFIHPFYEQYLTMWPDTARHLCYSVAAIFLVTFLFLGLDLVSALIVVFTIIMIIVDLMGLMYWWHIELNAISLVNLVVGVGISVEFCSHLTRTFALNAQPSKIQRAQHALQTMGTSILSGITLTDCGILVLAFAKSKLFVVFYFRMYLGIIAFGTLHALIFLPVFLSVVGPRANKAKMEKSRTNDPSVIYAGTITPSTNVKL